MTYFDRLETKEVVLLNPVTGEEALSLALGLNNDKPGRQVRLKMRWMKDYTAEIEIEPGPDCHGSPGNAIISQILMWAPRTPDGTGRQRLTMTIAQDSAGGIYGIIDSTTNDPTNSEGQRRSMPLLINAGEGKGVYVGLYPVDNTIDVQDRAADVSWGRNPVTRLIRHLKRIGK